MMKITKSLVFITAIVSMVSAFAAPLAPKIETGFPASKLLGASIWDLEFKNKYAAPVYITVTNNGRELLNKFEVPKPAVRFDLAKEKDFGYVRVSGLDLNKQTSITVYSYKTQIMPVAQYKIDGTGKTIYVSWEDGSLRPQKGKGIFDKTTQSGLSLKNNIETLK